ncbi:hypothetical protein B4N84_26445 [Flavobacterium sp. IR1]|nr:hypothetical protein B4N84_26445 [Flavobacterium sp. IR1]
MAEMGEKKTAKLLVTSHQKVILNDEKDKYFATEIDKTFDPPAATFGKCKMQPSSSGYLPCTLSAGPKWDKSYEKTKVLGNKVLTMKSVLKCVAFNGEIKIAKHGQTDGVMKEHADNTNPAAMALINSGVKMPEPEIRYPSVKSITLKSLKNNDAFKSVSSERAKSVEKVTVRPKQECTFEAKIVEGNVNLTSWVIYDGFSGDKDKRLFAEEQIGTSFKYTFPTPGKYRVEGYGKPKNDEFKKGAHNKNYPDCSLDIEVVENTLTGAELLPIDGENFFKVIGGKKRLRQNFPANFQAKFLMTPTDEELKNLKLYVTDGEGNVLKSTMVNNSVAFTPVNTKATYHFKGEYKTGSGEVLKQSFSGQTLSNTVSAISHNAEVIRAGTPMSFKVTEGTFSYFVPNDEKAETAINKEFQEVKWNLNGRLLGTGKSITIPGNQFLVKGKYVVEAFVMKANAYGTESVADEPDDWRFEVKDNDVMSFSYIEAPKVGKTTKLQADSFVFAKLTDVEKVVWNLAIPHKTVDKNTISITPVVAGKQNVKCSINHRAGKTLSIDVKQAKVLETLFTDSNGIEIQKASWGQKINIWIKQEYLLGEEIKVEVWDDDTTSADDRVATFTKPSYDGGLISFVLSPKVKEETGTQGKLYVRVTAPKLKLGNPNNVFESKNFLDVQDKRELYAAHIGSQDGTMRHYHVDYNQVSYFYAKSRGIDPKEQLNLTIYEKDKAVLEAKNVRVDDSGMIKIKLEWNQVSLKSPMLLVYAVVKGKDGKILYNGKTNGAGVALTQKSALKDLVEYKSAVFVGKGEAGGSGKNKSGTCICKENNFYWSNKLTCKERKKVLQVCASLWGEANKKQKASELMSIIHLETGNKDTFKPYADNGADFSGLIQFSDASAKSLGTTRAKLKAMTFIDQMKYVETYFSKKKDMLKTMTDLYLLVLKPTAVGNGSDPTYVVFDEEISVPDGDGSKTSLAQRKINISREPWVTKYGYASNPSFMKGDEHKKRRKWVYTRQVFEDRWGYIDGKTTVEEITSELIKSHYKPGASQLFNGECDDIEKTPKQRGKGKAPWMPFALKEIGQKAIAGAENNSRITEYFEASTNGKGLTESTNWCGAFASWCFTQAGYTPPGLSCRAAMWQFWKQDKPIYGSAAVIDWGTNQNAQINGKDGAVGGDGHITFIVGISEDGNHYYCVGGNQGGVRGARTVKISKYSKDEIDWFVIPPDYVPSSDEYNLDIMTNEADIDSANTTRT